MKQFRYTPADHAVSDLRKYLHITVPSYYTSEYQRFIKLYIKNNHLF